MEPFRLPSTSADIKKLIKAINMKDETTQLLTAQSIKGNRQVLENLNNTNQVFGDAISILKPTNDFCKISEKVQNRLKKVTPIINPIPEFNTNEGHKKAHKDLANLLTEILKITPPTLDIVKSKITELGPAVVEFSDFIKKLIKAENVDKSDAKKLFNSWIADLGNALSNIDSSKDFNITMANNLKLNLLNLLKKLSKMPNNIRDLLPPEQKKQLAQKLGELAKRSLELINIVRQLPGNKRITREPNDFRKIEADEELQDSIKILGEQCAKLSEFFKLINDAKVLSDRPFANQMLQEIQKQFSSVNLKDFEPKFQESKQLKTMQQLKQNIRPMIIKELIDFEKSTESLQKSSCVENSPENTAQFKRDLSNLMTYFICFESALVNTYDNLSFRVIQCFAKMAIAIQRNINFVTTNLFLLIQSHSRSTFLI